MIAIVCAVGVASCKREERGFREQLSEQAPAAGAHRAADCHFRLARAGASEHEVRDVRASDEKEKRDRAQKNEQRPPEIARDHFLQAHSVEFADGVIVRGVHARAEQIDFGLQALGRDARLEPADGAQKMGVEIFLEDRRV